jgi:hypothetical protein
MKINITPTWTAIMPAMISALQQQDLPDETRQAIRVELMRLARAADLVKGWKEQFESELRKEQQ